MLVNVIPSEVHRNLNDAERHYQCCHLCEHRCGVNRANGERGHCKAADVARVFRHRVEYGEELELIPSHLFYLSGCDLRCAFCIAEANAFDPSRGRELTVDFFRDAVNWGRGQGARNIQWVGGEPTIHLPVILRVMAQSDELPPVVWKSDFYGTPEAFSLLEGVVDTYVADFKFGNDACAERIAGVRDYTRIVTRNLKLAAGAGNLIIRHLLLPGHFDCCFVPIARRLRDDLPRAKFSIRDGFLPKWRARQFVELSSRLPAADAQRAREAAENFGLHLTQ